MAPLYLSEEQIKQYLHPNALLASIKSAFLEYTQLPNRTGQRIPIALPSGGTAMVLFPGLLPSIPAYTVKVHAKFPTHRPAIQGVILLHDLHQGRLLAMLDSPYLTAVRTALVGTLATDILARKEIKQVALIGAGVQGEFQLRFLPWIRTIEKVYIYDIVATRAKTLASSLQAESPFSIQVATSVEQAVIEADLIITATFSKQPFLFSHLIKPGTHITVLGSDELGKQEVSPELIENSLFVCDDRKLNVQMGAIGSAGLTEKHIHAELGELLLWQQSNSNKAKDLLIQDQNLQQNKPQITIFNAVGLPFLDLVASWSIYQRFLK